MRKYRKNYISSIPVRTLAKEKYPEMVPEMQAAEVGEFLGMKPEFEALRDYISRRGVEQMALVLNTEERYVKDCVDREKPSIWMQKANLSYQKVRTAIKMELKGSVFHNRDDFAEAVFDMGLRRTEEILGCHLPLNNDASSWDNMTLESRNKAVSAIEEAKTKAEDILKNVGKFVGYGIAVLSDICKGVCDIDGVILSGGVLQKESGKIVEEAAIQKLEKLFPQIYRNENGRKLWILRAVEDVSTSGAYGAAMLACSEQKRQLRAVGEAKLREEIEAYQRFSTFTLQELTAKYETRYRFDMEKDIKRVISDFEDRFFVFRLEAGASGAFVKGPMGRATNYYDQSIVEIDAYIDKISNGDTKVPPIDEPESFIDTSVYKKDSDDYRQLLDIIGDRYRITSSCTAMRKLLMFVVTGIRTEREIRESGFTNLSVSCLQLLRKMISLGDPKLMAPLVLLHDIDCEMFDLFHERVTPLLIDVQTTGLVKEGSMEGTTIKEVCDAVLYHTVPGQGIRGTGSPKFFGHYVNHLYNNGYRKEELRKILIAHHLVALADNVRGDRSGQLNDGRILYSYLSTVIAQHLIDTCESRAGDEWEEIAHTLVYFTRWWCRKTALERLRSKLANIKDADEQNAQKTLDTFPVIKSIITDAENALSGIVRRDQMVGDAIPYIQDRIRIYTGCFRQDKKYIVRRSKVQAFASII